MLKKVLKIIKWVILTLIVLGVVGMLSAYLLLRPTIKDIQENVFNRMSSISTDTFRLDTDTIIYDAGNSVISEINANNYMYVSIDNVSKYVIDGYIAVEDRNFMSHNGISIKGIVRAGIALIKNKGEITQGGSTITQQVLKNTVFTDIESKYERKILEIFLAPEFEKQYSKSQIMEFYLNTNYYQNGCYGIGSAANYYFGKSAKDLTLSESAILVGLSNNPSKYNPVKHPVESRNKRDRVLATMLNEGKITQEEYTKALEGNPLIDGQYELALKKEYREVEDYLTSYAVYGSAIKLMELDGFEFKYSFSSEAEYKEYKDLYNKTFTIYAEDVRNGNYKVYTSLNKQRQDELQRIVDNNLIGVSKEVVNGKYALQGSATLVNNYSGLVEAIVGGRGTEDEYNRGYLSYRQPGSSIKPLVVYAPAFETGNYYPSLVMRDYKGENFPHNANKKYLGDMNLREAIARSTNTIPYQILQRIGVNNGVKYLADMHFSGLTVGDFNNYSMALGGFTYGTNTAEMAKAYSTLASGGVYTNNTCILKIERNGEVVYEHSDKEKKQVYSGDVAYMVIDTLRGVSDLPYGTGKGAKVDGVYSVGKTGTTNSNKDAWYSGITTDYSLSVWVGYDRPKSVDIGSKVSMDIYKDMITYLYKGKTSYDFKRPVTVQDFNIDSKGNITDKDIGKKDIFSRTILDTKNLDEKERKEKELQLQMQREQENEKARIQSMEDDIASLKVYTIDSMDSYNSYIERYNYLLTDIGTIKDTSIQLRLKEELQNDYNTKMLDTTVLKYKADYERQQQEELELEAKRKNELAQQEQLNNELETELEKQKDLLNEQLKVNADLSLANLDSLILSSNVSLEDYDRALLDVREKVDNLKGSSIYGEYLSKLAGLEADLESKLIDAGYIVEDLNNISGLELQNSSDNMLETSEDMVYED